jgi:hypothetical protein
MSRLRRLRFTGVALPGNSTHWQAKAGRLASLGFTPLAPLEARVAAYVSWAGRETRGW